MSRSTLNFIVDSTILVTFLIALWSATLVQVVFPEGPQAAGWTLWGLNYVEWSRISFGWLCLFALGLLLHLILHWNWVCGFVTARLGRRRGKTVRLADGVKTIYGVTLLITVLTGLMILLAVADFAVVDSTPTTTPKTVTTAPADGP